MWKALELGTGALRTLELTGPLSKVAQSNLFHTVSVSGPRLKGPLPGSRILQQPRLPGASTLRHLQDCLAGQCSVYSRGSQNGSTRLWPTLSRAQHSASLVDWPRQVLQGVSSAISSRIPKPVTQLWDTAKSSPGMHRVLGLQAEAFWQNNHTLIITGALFLAGLLLWKTVSAVAIFMSKSQDSGMGSLVVAGCLLFAGYLFVRRRYSVDPEAVYRLALLKLNTHPGVLDVMGAPLAGSEMRAYVLTGGGLRMQRFGLSWRTRRIQMVFPLKGAERRGLAFLEAKKRKGAYLMKVLGVDVPSHGGQEERLYIVGDSTTYNRGGVLEALREPVVKAHLLKNVYEQEDDKDEAAEKEKAKLDRLEQEARKAEKTPKPMDEGGGMYSYEHVYWQTQKIWQQIRSRLWTRQNPV